MDFHYTKSTSHLGHNSYHQNLTSPSNHKFITQIIITTAVRPQIRISH